MVEPRKFRKRPVVIEAMQYDGTNAEQVAAWAVGGSVIRIDGLAIQTLEGVMTAQPGDWILRGVQGEFYPCKPDIFEATYEEAPDA